MSKFSIILFWKIDEFDMASVDFSVFSFECSTFSDFFDSPESYTTFLSFFSFRPFAEENLLALLDACRAAWLLDKWFDLW
jgi:hypothetical protein